MTKVSIIIPTRNRFKYLLNAIISVKEQTHPNIEIIVINDNSDEKDYYTTKLRDILPPNSLVIHCQSGSETTVGKEGRAAFTRNIGIKIASGDYIAFLDDDDVWLPTKLEKQLEHMERTRCEMSCTEGYIGDGLYDSQKTYPKYITEFHINYLKQVKNIHNFPPIWNKEFLLRHNNCVCSSVIISKNIINKIGFMPHKRVGEDYEYWLKALSHTDCVYVNEPLFYYDNCHGNGSLY